MPTDFYRADNLHRPPLANTHRPNGKPLIVTPNHKRVERIWRREGLKVPQRQPKCGRLWLNDGPCIRLRPEYPGHVWAYDFVEGRTHDGRKFRILTIIDEASRECLALVMARQLKHEDVLAALADCSSRVARRPIYGRTMAPSLSPMPCRNGSGRSA